jgi:hypothetical protein
MCWLLVVVVTAVAVAVVVVVVHRSAVERLVWVQNFRTYRIAKKDEMLPRREKKIALQCVRSPYTNSQTRQQQCSYNQVVALVHRCSVAKK